MTLMPGWARPAHRAGDKIRIGTTGGFDQDEIGFRREGMRPLNVQRFFPLPGAVGGAGAVGIGGGIIGAAVLRDLGEGGRIGQAILCVEDLQVGEGIGIVVGIDDGDGLAAAIADNIAKHDLIDAVGGADLGGSQRPGEGRRRMGHRAGLFLGGRQFQCGLGKRLIGGVRRCEISGAEKHAGFQRLKNPRRISWRTPAL